MYRKKHDRQERITWLVCVIYLHVKLFSSSFLIYLQDLREFVRAIKATTTATVAVAAHSVNLLIWLPMQKFHLNETGAIRNYFTGSNWPLIFTFRYLISVRFWPHANHDQNVDDLILAHLLTHRPVSLLFFFLDKS